MDVLPRLLSKIEIAPNGCWLFTGSIDKNTGYGHLSDGNGYPRLAHRLSYEAHKGPIPAGKILDHTCHNPTECKGGKTCMHRRCVNPDHVKPTTQKINTSAERSQQFHESTGNPRIITAQAIAAENKRNRTHCKKGHEFTDDTVIKNPDGSRRRCLICARICARDSARRRRSIGSQKCTPS